MYKSSGGDGGGDGVGFARFLPWSRNINSQACSVESINVCVLTVNSQPNHSECSGVQAAAVETNQWELPSVPGDVRVQEGMEATRYKQFYKGSGHDVGGSDPHAVQLQVQTVTREIYREVLQKCNMR